MKSNSPIISQSLFYILDVNFMSRDVVFAFADTPAALEKSISALINPAKCKEAEIPSSIIPTNFVAALNIQIKGSPDCLNFGSFKIAPEGNQLLPYMDMLNTLTKIASRQGIKADFDFNSESKLNIPSIFKYYIRTFLGHTSTPNSFLLQYVKNLIGTNYSTLSCLDLK
jgi:hypothetical protein